MMASIHQPNYIPWMGYFYKIYKSDIFIILDNAQYIKRGFINRNKIKTHQGDQWLTIPVRFTDSSRCKINEVLINNTLNWRENHLKNIEANYKRTDYFKEFFPILKDSLMYECKTLSDFNIKLIKKICEVLDIRTKILLSSKFDITEKSTMMIIKTCQAIGAEKYLSGIGGAKYQDEQLFKDYSIELEYTDFVQKPYKQCWGEFANNMSIIDYIFNCGFNIKSFWEDK